VTIPGVRSKTRFAYRQLSVALDRECVTRMFQIGVIRRLQEVGCRSLVYLSVMVSTMATLPLCVAQEITVKLPVRVSPAGAGGHFWSYGNTHAAPDDSKSIITCGIRIRTDPLSWEGYLYTSTDGGSNWRVARVDSALTQSGAPDLVSEPSCALGRSGSMYMNTSSYGSWHSTPFRLAHSFDGGLTWSQPLQRRGWYDATKSVVDNTGGAFDGTLYVFSNRLDLGKNPKVNACTSCYEPLLVSNDGGRSIRAAATDKPGNKYITSGWPSQAVVLNDGRAMAVHVVQFKGSERPGSAPASSSTQHDWGIDVVTSSDGGRSLDRAKTIRRWTRVINAGVPDPGAAGGVYELFASAAVDRSTGPNRGRVYVSWREGHDATAKSTIMMASSDDAGKTWSSARAVDDSPVCAQGESSDQSRGCDPKVPSIAVNANGVVGLLWTERSIRPMWRFTASFDGGKTFVRSVDVYRTSAFVDEQRPRWFNQYVTTQDRPSDWRESFKPIFNGTGFTLYTQFAEESTLVATLDGAFHAMWVTRDDGALWTARIQADLGQSAVRRMIDLENLSDVSDLIRMEAISYQLNSDSGLMQVDVQLVNKSDGASERQPWLQGDVTSPINGKSAHAKLTGTTLRAPMVMRITALQSEVGDIQIVNHDAVSSDGFSLIDWSAALPDGRLSPGQRSESKRIAIRVSNWTSTDDPNIVRVANVAARIFASVEKPSPQIYPASRPVATGLSTNGGPVNCRVCSVTDPNE